MIYFLTLLMAFSISIILTPVLRWVIIRMEIMDVPCERKIHLHPVPRMGGLAIIAAFYLATLFAWIYESQNMSVQDFYLQLLGIVFGSLLVVFLGIYDDIIEADVWHKLFVQFVAGVIVYVCGLNVSGMWLPYTGYIAFDPVTSVLLTTLWIVAVINIVNLIDGLDGLAAGVALMAAVVFAGISVMQGHVFAAIISCAFIGAISGFWPYNFYPARIFMGDAGSMFLGFLLGVLALLNGMTVLTVNHVAFSFLALGVPIFDTSYAIIRRLRKGRHVFGADKEHIHHQFMSSGLSHKKAVLAIYLISAVLSVSAFIVAVMGNSGFGKTL